MHLRCPHCQSPIERADLPSGGEITCAGCGSSFQLDQFATATFTAPANQRLGKFEILDTVGHGAFGTVFKAHDTELNRTVAIKVPRAGNVGPTQDDMDRFLREARAVAQLRFPSIISIHEVGLAPPSPGTPGEGSGVRVPYLVCDFVEGVTLADMLTGRGFSFKESAQLLAEVAAALQYAHSLGVVHRDVKPSNIMIQSPGEQSRVSGRLMDDDPGAANQPLTGLGSPDLKPVLMDFGLAKRDAGEITMTIAGQILGTPAYMSPEQARGESHRVDGRTDVYSLGVILYQLLTNELPFRGNKAMLLHQVLHEEPQRPRALNDKIPRDLETIALKAMAKEPGRRYGSAKEMADDLRRWLAGEPILARPVGAVERLWRWCRRKPALAVANAAVLLALATFVAAFFVVSASLEKEHIERANAQRFAKEAEALALRVQFEHYFSKAEDRPDVALVGMASLLPKAAQLQDQSLADSLRLRVGVLSENAARLKAIFVHPSGVTAVALSADGNVALTGRANNRAQLWDTATGKAIDWLEDQGGRVVAVALSADGKTAMTECTDRLGMRWATLWETAPRKPIGTPLQLIGNKTCVALSADGKRALTGTQVWDAVTGKPIGLPLQFDDPIVAAALSSDGKVAITGTQSNTVRTWETATGKPIGPPLPHHNGVSAVAISADGKAALTGSADGTAQLWETATGKQIGRVLQHQAGVCSVALSADGKMALTGSWDKTARLWDTASGNRVGLPLQAMGPVAVALTANGKTVLTAGMADNGARSGDATARLWETAADKPIGPPPRLEFFGDAVAVLSGDGKAALTAGQKQAQLRETITGKPIGPPLQHQDAVVAVALSADGKTALTGSWDKTARLWDAVAGNPIGPPLRHQDWVTAVALSGDGKIALTGSKDKTAQLWDAATGKPIGPPLQHQNEISALALSADNKTALTTDYDRQALLWSTATGKPIGLPLQHRGTVGVVALSADGKTVLTGSGDTARLWDAATGKPIGPPLLNRDTVTTVALSADGKTALTGCDGQTAQLWETATGKPIGPSLQHQENFVMAVALSADGKTALFGGSLRKVPQPILGSPERIMLWTQVITGLEVDDLTAVRVLDAATWRERRERLEKLGGPPVLD